MSLGSERATWRREAEDKISQLHEEHDTQIGLQKRSVTQAKLAGLVLGATSAVNLYDLYSDIIPSSWEGYARLASGVSVYAAAGGLIGIRVHAEQAASKARTALYYVIGNKIDPPRWIEPYLSDNLDIVQE